MVIQLKESDVLLHCFLEGIHLHLHLLICKVCLCAAQNLICGWFQTFGHQLQVGLVENHLGQVLLSFDLFLDSVRDVWDHVGQDELGEVNNVLQ